MDDLLAVLGPHGDGLVLTQGHSGACGLGLVPGRPPHPVLGPKGLSAVEEPLGYVRLVLVEIVDHLVEGRLDDPRIVPGPAQGLPYGSLRVPSVAGHHEGHARHQWLPTLSDLYHSEELE